MQKREGFAQQKYACSGIRQNKWGTHKDFPVFPVFPFSLYSLPIISSFLPPSRPSPTFLLPSLLPTYHTTYLHLQSCLLFSFLPTPWRPLPGLSLAQWCGASLATELCPVAWCWLRRTYLHDGEPAKTCKEQNKVWVQCHRTETLLFGYFRPTQLPIGIYLAGSSFLPPGSSYSCYFSPLGNPHIVSFPCFLLFPHLSANLLFNCPPSSAAFII